MKIPLSWLEEFVDVDLDVDELVDVMDRHGLEVDDVRHPGRDVAGVRLARVLDIADHPEADRLVVVTVDDGEGERTVCAGARNIVAGDLVPFAPPGATLPSSGGVMTIARRELRGVTSDGMLCSARELGVADDHAGILVVDGATLAAAGNPGPGADIHDVFPLGEPVVDVAVQADRGDLHSILGIARDLAAILGVDCRRRPVVPERVAVDGAVVGVTVTAAEGCSSYVGWVVEGARPGPSPWWLRRRLEACGIRSLMNLIDVTNYVMLEVGQPLHAFDLDRLHGPEVVVRWAGEGEELKTLDGRVRRLAPDDLVIADADRAVALAGVMGGEDTEVGPATRRILLEAATFDPAAVRRTSRRLGLVSEASIRFERGVDPQGAVGAAERAVGLLADVAAARDGGCEVGGPGAPPPAPVPYDPARAARFIGVDHLDTPTQTALLTRAGVAVSDAGGGLVEATPPSWRTDLRRPADLAEEVARLYGYERIPAVLPPVAARGGLTPRQRAERGVRAAARAGGFHEAQTVPFVGDGAVCLLHPEDAGRVWLRNPVSRDAGIMRPSLAEGLLGAARRNAGQGMEGAALFEVGRVFRLAGGPLDPLADAGAGRWTGPEGEPLPTQPLALGLVAYGVHHGADWLHRGRHWTVFDLLATLDEVAARLAPPDAGRGAPSADPPGRLERAAATHPALHPGRTASLRWGGVEVGVAGQLHPLEADARDLPETTVVAEIVLEPLWGHLLRGEPAPRQAAALVRHPAVTVDVAVVADEDIPYARVESAVREGAGDLLEELKWFDEFRGDPLPAGKRSLAFRLRLQSPQRQLTDADAEEVIDRVEAAVGRIGGALRR